MSKTDRARESSDLRLEDELRLAAQALGEALRAITAVSEYLDAQSRLQADADASALDRYLTQLYGGLVARQRRGEVLSETEVHEFNVMRDHIFGLPLVARRNHALSGLQTYLAGVAEVLSEPLGIDFTALRPSGETSNDTIVQE